MLDLLSLARMMFSLNDSGSSLEVKKQQSSEFENVSFLLFGLKVLPPLFLKQ